MIDLEKLKQAREAATPGPWLCGEDPEGNSEDKMSVHTEDGFYICLVDRARAEKDTAALIAMAPDLADAVIELAEALGEIANQLRIEEMNAEMVEGADWEYGYDKCIETARAALAKHIKGEAE